jgi:hypothetical protein
VIKANPSNAKVADSEFCSGVVSTPEICALPSRVEAVALEEGRAKRASIGIKTTANKMKIDLFN